MWDQPVEDVCGQDPVVRPSTFDQRDQTGQDRPIPGEDPIDVIRCLEHLDSHRAGTPTQLAERKAVEKMTVRPSSIDITALVSPTIAQIGPSVAASQSDSNWGGTLVSISGPEPS